MTINAKNVDYKDLNEALRAAGAECEISSCLGQRYIAAGLSDKKITINGIPGNALGAYLNGAVIEVMGNAQDAVGDTMNDGEIVVHGNIGDATGYAMRDGKVFVLGVNGDEKPIVSNFPGTGMHGGKMFLRSSCTGIKFPSQVHARCATDENLQEIKEYIKEFCKYFDYDESEISNSEFTLITPDSKNPYKQMYVAN